MIADQNILIITETPPGTPNGFGVTLQNLFEGKKYETIFTDESFIKYSKPDKVTFAHVPNHRGKRYALPFFQGKNPEWRGNYSRRWLKTIVKHNFQIVYAFIYSSDTLKFSKWVSKELNLSLIVHIADHSEDLLEGNCKNIIKNCWKLVVISENMKKLYSNNIKERNISIIHNGASKKNFCIKPHNIISKFNSKNPFRVVHIGALYENMHSNSIEDILNAISKLQQKGIPIQFHGYGRTIPDNFIKLFINNKYIYHHGIVMPLDKRWEILESAHCLIIPSSFEKNLNKYYRFSFPTKLCEYLATGIPTFVYGPNNTAAINFLKSNNISNFIDKRSEEEVAALFNDMINDYHKYLLGAECAKHVIKQNHTIESQRDILEKVLTR